MKRCIVILLSLLLIIPGLFAVGTGVGENESQGTIDGVQATTEVTLNVGGGEASSNKVKVGFTTDALSGSFSNKTEVDPATTFTLSLNEQGPGVHSETTPNLYAFWQITSGSPLEIKLYANDKMQISGADADNEKLDWQATWTSEVAGGTGESQVTGSLESGHTYGDTDSKIVFDRSSVTTVGDAGYVPITLMTASVLDKAPGAYSGTLTLVVNAKDTQST